MLTREEIDGFYTDLATLVSEKDLDSKKLYDKHPKIRIGIRRAFVILEKGGILSREQIVEYINLKKNPSEHKG